MARRIGDSVVYLRECGGLADESGIQGMRVWKELAPGLPSCISLGASPKYMILKSGSSGRTEFLADALAHLRS